MHIPKLVYIPSSKSDSDVQHYVLLFFLSLSLCVCSLHDFSPHGGEAVTRLIFCDDHTTRDELSVN